MNDVKLTGNLVRDPELTPVGQSQVCKFTLAVNEGFGDKQKTYFFDCEAWGKIAENIASYVSKGKKVLVSGILEQQKWEKDGQKRSKIIVKVIRQVEFMFANTEPSKTSSMSNGDRVYAKDFGPDFPATIKSFTNTKATLEFDDGDSGEYAFSEIIYMKQEEKDDIPF